MPLFLAPLVTWFSGALFSLAMWFITRNGILFTALLAVIALIGTAIDLLVEEIDSLMTSIMPSTIGLFAPFVPDNMSLCLSVIVSAHLICTAYRLTMKYLHWKTTIMLA